jgi:hypothetical protein
MAEIINEDMQRWSLQHTDGRGGIKGYYRSHLGVRVNNQHLVKTVVFSGQGLRAYTCAHGEVWVSSEFLDPDNKRSLNDNELYALLAHEFVHYRDADVLLQRIAAANRDVSRGQEYFEILVSWVTTLLKIIGPLVDMEVDGKDARPPYRHDDTTEISRYARYAWLNNEYDADSRALDIMEQTSRNTNAYLTMLSKLKERQRSTKESTEFFSELISKRIECVRTRLANPDLYYWLPYDPAIPEGSTGDSGAIGFGLESNFFMRHNSPLAKAMRQGTLPHGAPELSSKKFKLTPADIHTLCGMFHVIRGLDEEAPQHGVDLSKSKKYLSWLSKSREVTLNEVLSH